MALTTPPHRLTASQTALLEAYAVHDLGWLTAAEARDWAQGREIPAARAARARQACEALGIEAVWL